MFIHHFTPEEYRALMKPLQRKAKAASKVVHASARLIKKVNPIINKTASKLHDHLPKHA